MEKKYDLKAMLQEIQMDEKLVPKTTRTMSQDEIKERLARRRKEKADAR